MRHLDFRKSEPLSTWRKIALGTWGPGGDPSVYGVTQIDATKILERRHMIRSTTGQRQVPTLTAIMGAACAQTFEKYPNLNGLVRFGTIYLRKNVTLFFQAAVDSEGRELSGVQIENAEKKDVYQIMKEIDSKVEAIRTDRDPAFKKVKSTFSGIPPFFMNWILTLTSFFMYTLNLNLTWLGLPRDPFGSIMITNIGSIGMDFAFAPLVPYSRVPVLLAVGAIQEQPVIKHGQIQVAPLFNLCTTFDHRFIDGVYGAKMVKTLRHYLETDEGLDELGFVART